MTSKKLLQAIIDAVPDCTVEVKVCVPSSDYYARADEWSCDTIKVINPDRLTERLEELMKEMP